MGTARRGHVVDTVADGRIDDRDTENSQESADREQDTLDTDMWANGVHDLVRRKWGNANEG